MHSILLLYTDVSTGVLSLVLMMVDLPLKLVFLFKVGLKWEGVGRVSSRVSFYLDDL